MGGLLLKQTINGMDTEEHTPAYLGTDECQPTDSTELHGREARRADPPIPVCRPKWAMLKGILSGCLEGYGALVLTYTMSFLYSITDPQVIMISLLLYSNFNYVTLCYVAYLYIGVLRRTVGYQRKAQSLIDSANAVRIITAEL